MLKSSFIDTPLGPIVAIADENALHALEFAHQSVTDAPPGKTKPIEQIERELELYFSGQLRSFKTPLFLAGTPFQKFVWEALQKIPFGETRSYAELAKAIGKPTAYRAAAQANGANPFPIIIPCHRVINSNGGLGGYSGGLGIKELLLTHEKLALSRL